MLVWHAWRLTISVRWNKLHRVTIMVHLRWLPAVGREAAICAAISRYRLYSPIAAHWLCSGPVLQLIVQFNQGFLARAYQCITVIHLHNLTCFKSNCQSCFPGKHEHIKCKLLGYHLSANILVTHLKHITAFYAVYIERIGSQFHILDNAKIMTVNLTQTTMKTITHDSLLIVH